MGVRKYEQDEEGPLDTIDSETVRAELVGRRTRLEQAIGRGGTSAQVAALIAEVDAALERLAAGTFGACDVCHDPIEPDRLMADPLIRTCIDHMTAGEQRALELDLELASRIQLALLPKHQLALAGWEVVRHFEPAGPVGGDYCDVIATAGGAGTFFLLGDVSGKGVAASILMANLHAMFRTLADADLPLADLMARANRLFCQSTMDNHYATLVCGRASAAGEVEIVNAGHWPALVVRRDRVEPVASTGLALGLFCASTYERAAVCLAAGDLLVFYTDGLCEARSPDGEEYGVDRLTAVVGRTAARDTRDPARVMAECLADLTRFRAGVPLGDDLTMMVVQKA